MKKLITLFSLFLFSYSSTLIYQKGWSLKSLLVDKEVNASVFKAVSIWIYKDGNWSANSSYDNIKKIIKESGYKLFNIIKAGEGFWIYSDKNNSIELDGDTYSIFDKTNFSKLKNGWYLLGSGEDILVDDFPDNIKIIWKFKNNKWYGFSKNKDINKLIASKYQLIDNIKKGEGFWVYVENKKNISDSEEYDNNISNFEENITTIDKALDYLNYLRNETGMISLDINNNLNQAALNHSIYMKTNNIFSHYEIEGYPNFTGKTPSDRAVYAGYLSKVVLENISYGEDDYKSSIDDLMSAIYHRLGFLDLTINEIGIGKDDKFFTYDMGNSYLNNLCAGDSFEGYGAYYMDVCSDENKKIKLTDFDNSIEKIEKQNPKIVLWPPKNSNNILPVFYEEEPDPLPDYSVSGYPVSVVFNKFYFKKPPNLISFKLFDKNGEITDTRLIDKNSDLNNKFDEYSYALFPLKRLDWNTQYKAKVVYEDNNSIHTIEWNFTTKKLPYPLYKVNDTQTTLEVTAGKTYVIYFVPKNENDVLGTMQCKYLGNIKIDEGYIDQNTIYIKLTGEKDGYAECSFSNGNKIKLVISN